MGEAYWANVTYHSSVRVLGKEEDKGFKQAQIETCVSLVGQDITAVLFFDTEPGLIPQKFLLLDDITGQGSETTGWRIRLGWGKGVLGKRL
jgi:hypothetical protein